jgi:uncharacterized protein (DUF433 family)
MEKATGETSENILQTYPQLEKQDIQACLQFAASTLERKMYAFELAC